MKKFIILALLILSACATISDEERQKKYENMLQSWIGTPVENRVSRNGLPTKIMDLPSGSKVYEWSNSTNSYQSTYNQGVRAVSTNEYTYYCTTDLTVDKKGVIIKWSYTGNNCF